MLVVSSNVLFNIKRPQTLLHLYHSYHILDLHEELIHMFRWGHKNLCAIAIVMVSCHLRKSMWTNGWLWHSPKSVGLVFTWHILGVFRATSKYCCSAFYWQHGFTGRRSWFDSTGLLGSEFSVHGSPSASLWLLCRGGLIQISIVSKQHWYWYRIDISMMGSMLFFVSSVCCTSSLMQTHFALISCPAAEPCWL